jgi:spermidine/putrescine transport system permease protein
MNAPPIIQTLIKKPLLPEQRSRLLGTIYTWPMGVWFTLFFLVPIVIIFAYSFMKKGLYGGVEATFSLDAFRVMFNPRYAVILFRTLEIALISTIISVLIALPCGYAMARSTKQTILLILVIIPFWTNSLIRIFAWMTILGNDGIINRTLLNMGIIKDYIQLLYNKQAVILVSIYMYLPYAILPIFTAIDRFDFSLLEAGRDLGATKFEAMLKVLIPNIKSGVITAIIFTFIPIFGAYTVPLIVGGKDSSTMMGTVIADQVNKTRNWPFAAAFSVAITVISAAGVLWMMSSSPEDKENKSHRNGHREEKHGAA